MYNKYRLIVQTRRGGYSVASVNSVNDLVGVVRDWLDNTPAGRSVYDDQVHAVILYQLDPETGAYVMDRRRPATSRKDIIKQTRLLGGR